MEDILEVQGRLILERDLAPPDSLTDAVYEAERRKTDLCEVLLDQGLITPCQAADIRAAAGEGPAPTRHDGSGSADSSGVDANNADSSGADSSSDDSGVGADEVSKAPRTWSAHPATKSFIKSVKTEKSRAVRASDEELVYEGPVSVGAGKTRTSVIGSRNPASAEAALELPVGRLIGGRFRVETRLGAGGMGVVYRVHDDMCDRKLAIKVLQPALTGDARAVERFRQEVALMLELAHPRIVRAFDIGNDAESGLQFFTMELLEGMTLRDYLESNPPHDKGPDLKFAVGVVKQILKALDFAHAKTVHRDLKPENIFLAKASGQTTFKVKVLDFGLAKVQDPTRRTATSMAMGTAYYMAPEQTQSAREVDQRADLYSLSVILYELLTGSIPMGRFKRPHDVFPRIPGDLSDLVLRGLSADPAERPGSAASYLAALRECLRRPIDKRAPSSSGRTRRQRAGVKESGVSSPSEVREPGVKTSGIRASGTKASRSGSVSEGSTGASSNPRNPGSGGSISDERRKRQTRRTKTPARRHAGKDSPARGRRGTSDVRKAVAGRSGARSREPGRGIALAIGSAVLVAVAALAIGVRQRHSGDSDGSSTPSTREVARENARNPIMVDPDRIGRGADPASTGPPDVAVETTLDPANSDASADPDVTAPTLTLDPAPGRVKADTLLVSGQLSEEGCRVTVNGRSAIVTGRRFHLKVRLVPGPNELAVVAVDSSGNVSRRSRTVTFGTTLVVAPKGGDFTSISAAVAAARSGEKILVRPGLYNEQIDLSKSLEIVGDGAVEEIIIQSEGTTIKLSAPAARLSGLSVRSMRAKGMAFAIVSGRSRIKSCVIKSSPVGMVIHGAEARPVLTDCQFVDCANQGLLIANDAAPELKRCRFSGNFVTGMYVSGASPKVEDCEFIDNRGNGAMLSKNVGGTFDRCLFKGNGYAGLELAGSADPLIRECRFVEGKQAGARVRSGARGVFEMCRVTANALAGVVVSSGAKLTIRKCQIYRGKQGGLLINEAGEADISDCDITMNGLSNVEVREKSKVRIRGTKIVNGRKGGLLVADRGTRAIVEACRITGNILAGVEVRQGANALIHNAAIEHNRNAGIWLHTGGTATLSACTFSGNTPQQKWVEGTAKLTESADKATPAEEGVVSDPRARPTPKRELPPLSDGTPGGADPQDAGKTPAPPSNEKTPLPDLDKATPDELLADHRKYVRATRTQQDAAIKLVGRRLRGHYRHIGTKRYRCGGGTFRIATFRHRRLGLELNLLPGGTYRMGAKVGVSFARPVHETRVRPFLMGRFELIQSQWAAVAGKSPSVFKGDDLPVERVTWNQVQDWLKKAGGGLRLPSEAEWEYACRSGTTSRYFWGDTLDGSYCWFVGNSQRTPRSPLEHRSRTNAFGLIDMLGNVSEWCQDDWADDYKSGPATHEPRVRGGHSMKALRGGAWDLDATKFGSAWRERNWPQNSRDNLGFRVALSIPR